MNRKLSAAARREENWGWIMVAPTIIGLGVLNIWPFIQTIYTSFCEHLGFGRYKFIGLGNYAEMLGSTEFWKATWNTIFFCILTVPVGVALAQGVFTAIAQQNSIAFVMFTMAKGGSLPKFMAKMNKRTNSPLNAVIFIICLSVVLTLIFHFSGINMNTVAKISNFGALSTYTLLNLAVIMYCWVQLKQRKGAKNVFMHLIFPALGAAVCFAIMLSVGDVALTVGAIFILIGLAYYLVLTKLLHREINLG